MRAAFETGGRTGQRGEGGGVEFSEARGAANENVFNISSGDKTQSMEIKYHRYGLRHESRKVLHTEDKSMQLEKLQFHPRFPLPRWWWRRRWRARYLAHAYTTEFIAHQSE